MGSVARSREVRQMGVRLMDRSRVYDRGGLACSSRCSMLRWVLEYHHRCASGPGDASTTGHRPLELGTSADPIAPLPLRVPTEHRASDSWPSQIDQCAALVSVRACHGRLSAEPACSQHASQHLASIGPVGCVFSVP